MKKYICLSLLAIFFSCSPLYKKYQYLNNDIYKGKLYSEQLKILKPILSKENETIILIISWKKNILIKNGNLYYTALVYNPPTGEKKIIKTTYKKPEMVSVSDIVSDPDSKEFVYILDNYLNGNEGYLLSLKDSFSSSETGFPYYIYDFTKNKKIKINSFVFDQKGKPIQ